MQILRRVVVLVSALALCSPALTYAQMPEVPPSAPGVSTQPPVQLDGGRAEEEPRPAPPDPGAGELPNTGSDPRLLFLAGVALTLLGVGLRLRTADAELY